MTKKTLLAGLLAVLSVTTFAQTPASKIKDARTKPDLFFLQDGQQASSLDLLPAPPQPGSIQFLYDESQYQWGKMQRDFFGSIRHQDQQGDHTGDLQARSEYARRCR